MMPRRYSVREVRHFPCSDEDSALRTRFSSAHSLNVCRGGGVIIDTMQSRIVALTRAT